MNDFTPQTFLEAIAGEIDVLSCFRTITGWEPDEFQRTLLVTGPEEPLIACLAGRGTGKSLTIAIKALYHATTTTDAVVLCLSASIKQAIELFRTIKIVHSKLPLAHMITRETANLLQLANGSRIIVISASERQYGATRVNHASRLFLPLQSEEPPVRASNHQQAGIARLIQDWPVATHYQRLLGVPCNPIKVEVRLSSI